MNPTLIRLLLALACALVPLGTAAQGYPNKPVKVVVSFTPGGTTDILARAWGQYMAEQYKQPFVVDNRPGAGGNIGTEFVVQSPGDGYTVLVGSVGPIAVNPALKKLPYDPRVDLVAVAQIAEVPNVLVVLSSLGPRNLKEFIAWTRANPWNINYASTGVGTSAHLAGFMLATQAGFAAEHIPYKGAEALKDLLGGRIQFMFATIPSVIAHIRAGTLVALAVTSKERSRSMPAVPTLVESGYAVEVGSWFGVFAPKGTPESVVWELNRATNEFVKQKSTEEWMVREGADPRPGSPREFAAFVDRETEKYRDVVKASGAATP
jgi:tripartite-type tricarboxylate transporter receptor subunit TctC